MSKPQETSPILLTLNELYSLEEFLTQVSQISF